MHALIEQQPEAASPALHTSQPSADYGFFTARALVRCTELRLAVLAANDRDDLFTVGRIRTVEHQLAHRREMLARITEAHAIAACS